MALRSKLVIVVPEADGIVGYIRRAHDPDAAAGLPAYIPLLSPFLPSSELNDSVLIALVSQFARDPDISGNMDLCLDRVVRSPDRISLALADPAPVRARMTALTHAYRREHAGEVAPLLSVACGDAALFDRLEQELGTMLPITARVSVVSLFVERSLDRWHETFRFRLH